MPYIKNSTLVLAVCSDKLKNKQVALRDGQKSTQTGMSLIEKTQQNINYALVGKCYDCLQYDSTNFSLCLTFLK